MSDWKDKLTDDELEEWEQFEANVCGSTVPAILSSAYVASCIPDAEDVDVKFAVELGLAIMLGKPIIAIVVPGVTVPDGIQRVAHAVVVLDDSSEEARAKSCELLKEAMDSLPEPL